MLILSRRVGEYIVIGDNIKVRVSGIDRGCVRLAIEAPKDVRVDRSEVAERRDADAQAPKKVSNGN